MHRFCARNGSFGGSGQTNVCPYRSGPSAFPGGCEAVLPDQLIPTHCERSFPGTKDSLVCDQIPGLTKPGSSTLLPSHCIATRTPSRITSPCQPPPPCSLFSPGGISSADSPVQRVAAEQGWGGGSGPFKPLSMRFTRLRASCSFLLLPSLAGVVC